LIHWEKAIVEERRAAGASLIGREVGGIEVAKAGMAFFVSGRAEREQGFIRVI